MPVVPLPCWHDALPTTVAPSCHGPVEIAKPDTYLDLRGAKIDMVNNSMRLAVAPGGSMEAVTGHTFNPRVRVAEGGAEPPPSMHRRGCPPMTLPASPPTPSP